MSNETTIIQEIEAAQLKKDIPDYRPGDTVVVKVKVKEGTRERLQAFEGVVIAKRNHRNAIPPVVQPQKKSVD